MRRDDRNKLGKSIDDMDHSAIPDNQVEPLHTDGGCAEDNYDWSQKSGKSIKIQDLSKEMFEDEQIASQQAQSENEKQHSAKLDGEDDGDDYVEDEEEYLDDEEYSDDGQEKGLPAEQAAKMAELAAEMGNEEIPMSEDMPEDLPEEIDEDYCDDMGSGSYNQSENWRLLFLDMHLS